jgi:predicted nucleic acid-binding protein
VRHSVFLDTGIFIALMNRRDRWHLQAVALFGGEQPKWSTSYLVVSEGWSWFLHRMGEEAARTFATLLDHLEGLKIYPITIEQHREVRRMLDRYRGSKLTYVDASSLSLIAEYGIQQVWSTDHHLGITGVQVLPR